MMKDTVVVSTLSIATATLALYVGTVTHSLPIVVSPLLNALIIISFTVAVNLIFCIPCALASRFPPLLNFAKFCIIGLFNTVFDISILTALSQHLHVYDGYALAALNIISFSVATMVSYALNSYWTFSSTRPHTSAFAAFVTVVGTGALINTGVVFLITTYVIPPMYASAAQWVVVAKVAGVALSLVWNFMLLYLIVFKRRAQHEREVTGFSFAQSPQRSDQTEVL